MSPSSSTCPTPSPSIRSAHSRRIIPPRHGPSNRISGLSRRLPERAISSRSQPTLRAIPRMQYICRIGSVWIRSRQDPFAVERCRSADFLMREGYLTRQNPPSAVPAARHRSSPRQAAGGRGPVFIYEYRALFSLYKDACGPRLRMPSNRLRPRERATAAP